MRITLIVLVFSSLTILCIKCAKILSVSRSLNFKGHSKDNNDHDDKLYGGGGVWKSQADHDQRENFKKGQNDNIAVAIDADDIDKAVDNFDNFLRHQQLANMKQSNHYALKTRYRSGSSMENDTRRRKRLNNAADIGDNLSTQSMDSVESSEWSIPFVAVQAVNTFKDMQRIPLNEQLHEQFITYTNDQAELAKWQKQPQQQRSPSPCPIPPPHITFSTALTLTALSNDWNRFFVVPSNYWSMRCIIKNENNCLAAYYRCSTSYVDRTKLLEPQFIKSIQIPDYDFGTTSKDNDLQIIETNLIEDKIPMLQAAKTNTMKFLNWTLMQWNVTPWDFNNFIDNKSDYLKSQKQEMQKPPYYKNIMSLESLRKNTIFIPIRGRKQDLTFNLDKDPSVATKPLDSENLGKRQNIADILIKSDDLFYPNRGKRYTMKENLNRLNSIDEKDAKQNVMDLPPFSASKDMVSDGNSGGTLKQKQQLPTSNEMWQIRQPAQQWQHKRILQGIRETIPKVAEKTPRDGDLNQ